MPWSWLLTAIYCQGWEWVEPYLYSPLSAFMVWRGNTSNFTRNCTSVQYLLTCLLTYLLAHSIQHSPSWEANRFSASQETPLLLRNPKIHYHIHKCLPTVLILSQIDLIHNPTYWISILIFSSHPCLGLPSVLFPSGFPTQILYTPLLSTIHDIRLISRPTHAPSHELEDTDPNIPPTKVISRRIFIELLGLEKRVLYSIYGVRTH